ncbi:uncharacterized protein LOC134822573 isoform X2 [Bolinopsis microptera]|uniref:uncharacterized protein LOC134822573 isoform X2 n=1 Tax=Bolinopsis microptera TaxID=2820187 RepID=UPI003079C675
MIPKVKVPANFGREFINSPVHGNLVLNLKDGSVLRVNSVIMSLNSPVIRNITTNLCQSSLEMDDFSVEAVHCFVDAMYSGEAENMDRDNFEDVNKMAYVFDQRYPDQFVEVVDLMTELSGGSESGKVKELVEKVVKLRSEGVAGGSDEVLEDSQCSGDSKDSDDEDVQESCKDVAIQTDEFKTGWMQIVSGKFYPLLPDEPVQFITTDNELQKDIAVYYNLPVEGCTDEKWFGMICENKDTSLWSYCIAGCTVLSYNTQYLDSVPPDKVKHWIITKTCTHLKVVCNNVTVLNFNFATDYSPGYKTDHQIWLRRCTAVRFRTNCKHVLLLKEVD